MWDLSNPVDDIFAQTIMEVREGQIIRGVMKSASFVGTAGSCFAGHWEDMNLYSVNFHLGGEPKIW